MESLVKKKARINGEEDRISRLSDELLHKILSFLHTKLAVQTSVLSKRWKLVWTTLPFLKFRQLESGFYKNTHQVACQVLTHRNHQTPISSLELIFLPRDLIGKFVRYSISRNVEYLRVALFNDPEPFMLSNFNSSCIRKLELGIIYDYNMLESDCWDLPCLTTLHLTAFQRPDAKEIFTHSLPEFCLARLPALTTLCLRNVRLESLCLPNLITLELSCCNLISKVWNLPALKCLTLDDVVASENIMNDIFDALVGLQNLTLSFFVVNIRAYRISCPQLLNLEIRTRRRSYETFNKSVVVLAPKLCNFTSVGIFSITFIFPKLYNAHIKLRDSIDDYRFPREKLKEYYEQFPYMLARLRNAKILNLDLEAFKALSLISDFLEYFSSPFSNLKYVKLPHGRTETSISSTLRSFLIDGSPTATIVTALPQHNMIPQIAAAAVTAQNVVPQKPSASPTKVLVDSETIHRAMCIDAVDMKVQDENVAQNSALAVDKVRQIGAPVERTGNDQASNSRGNRDFGLWHGHEINSEFVCLLDLIMNKYPQTFEHFTTKNKKFSTMKLNMLCTSVIKFTKILMSEIDTELIAESRDVFSGLQKFGFNVSWLVNRLNYVEKLRFSQPLAEINAIECLIVDAKTKLQDLQTLRAEKMQEIQKAFGTMGWGGYTGAANTGRSQREVLKSYKQFIQELEDDILPAEAERRYQEYKSEYITAPKRAYFNAHKYEKWLKDKYHPTNLLAVIDRRNEHARKMAKDFLLELLWGTVDIGPGIDASASKAGQTADTNSVNEVDAGGKMKRHQRGLAKETDFTKAHPVSSEPKRVIIDIEQAQALVRKLDLEKGVEYNILCRTDNNRTSRDKCHGSSSGPVIIIQGSTSVKGLEGIELLDTLVTYLWRIHGVDYYGLIETNEPKGLRHVRADGKNSDATGNGDEWEKKLDSFWKERLNGQDPLEIMTAKEKIDAAAGELLDSYVRKMSDEVYGWKYGCGAKGCTKFFEEAKFINKHIKLKHRELLLEVTSKVQEDLYFQNYMG